MSSSSWSGVFPTPQSYATWHRMVQRGFLPLREPRHVVLGVRPAFHDEIDPSWRRTAPEQVEKCDAIVLRPLGDHLDAPVPQVAGVTVQLQRGRPPPRPPAEADPLHVTVHPGRETYVR